MRVALVFPDYVIIFPSESDAREYLATMLQDDGQDRESYSDDQDRESYDVHEDLTWSIKPIREP